MNTSEHHDRSHADQLDRLCATAERSGRIDELNAVLEILHEDLRTCMALREFLKTEPSLHKNVRHIDERKIALVDERIEYINDLFGRLRTRVTRKL